MTRGFTLLELLITLAIMGALLAWVAPSFSTLSTTSKMQRLASELQGFVTLGKSEAILKRRPLWGHFIASGASDSQGNWRLELTDSDTEGSGNVLFQLSGKPFDGLTVGVTYTSEQISFDETHGRPKNGSFFFYPNSNTTERLELITFHRSAITRVCSASGSELYGYKVC